MTRTPRLLPLLSTPRVARSLLGGVLCLGLAHSHALAQGATILQVQEGDTASALALPLVPEGATLDQMLLALLRANPDAFIDSNVNLLRAGQALHVPERAQVLQLSAEQARETVLDHHNRFRDYAQRLAAQAHALPDSPAREMSGKVSQPSTARSGQGAGQDRLLLTKDLQDAQALKIAVEKQTQEAMAHLAALQKNIEQLQQLSQAPQASASAPATPAPQASAPATPAPLPDTEAMPVWAWVAGLLAVALALVFGLKRRRTAARKALPTADTSVVVPPQMAGISLDLDSPASGTGTDRQP